MGEDGEAGCAMDWTKFGWAIIPLLLIGVVCLLRYTPSDEAIARNMVVRIDEQSIEHKDVGYAAAWGEEIIHEGDLRQIVRAYNRQAPVITRDAVVTTGEFSDPDIVHIAPLKRGSTIWNAGRQSEGSLVVLHIIPVNLEIQHRLAELDEGDRVRFTGHHETDSRIENSYGGYVELGHSNHLFLLVTGVEGISP
jgi:hypothetical protein